MLSSRRKSRRSAFTMVELMIAATILMIAVLSTFVAQIGSNNLLRVSRETNTGMADLETAMESVLLRPVDEIPIATSPFKPNVPIAAFTNLHLSGETIVPTYPGYAGGTIPDPLEIVLTLRFKDFKGRQRTMQLASMKTR
jgi:type II secretory pathway pseudopilin PulG